MSYEYIIDDDIISLTDFLKTLDKESYPYNIDPFFTKPDIVKGFALYAKNDDQIIATYAARLLDYARYEKAFSNWAIGLKGTYSKVIIPEGVQWYSSCQWVHPNYRGQELGITMDRKKKDEIWNRGGTVNYANCREGLKDYHIDKLQYTVAQHQAFIPVGNVGGSGTEEDKNYYIVYETSS